MEDHAIIELISVLCDKISMLRWELSEANKKINELKKEWEYGNDRLRN